MDPTPEALRRAYEQGDETLTVGVLANRVGLPYAQAYRMLVKAGTTIQPTRRRLPDAPTNQREKAASTARAAKTQPIIERRAELLARLETTSVPALSAEFDVSVGTMRRHLGLETKMPGRRHDQFLKSHKVQAILARKAELLARLEKETQAGIAAECKISITTLRRLLNPPPKRRGRRPSAGPLASSL